MTSPSHGEDLVFESRRAHPFSSGRDIRQKFFVFVTHPLFMEFTSYAGVLAILGILLIVAPWTFAPVCEVHGMYVQTATGKQLPMPCGYTARAEIGVGAMVMVAAGALVYSKSSESRRIVSVFGVALGVLAILIPTTLIGMCALADHTCRTMTQPTLLILGLGIIVVSLIVFSKSRQ